MRASLSVAFQLAFFLGLYAQVDGPPPVRTFVPFTQKEVVLHVDSPLIETPNGVVIPGQVQVMTDPRVERAMADYSERKHAQQGFRVQIFLGERRVAEETKRAYLLKYPDSAAYLSWLAPNFRLRVGDLRTRLEAERLLRDLKDVYPGSYIVPDEIEPPMLPTPKEQ